MYCIIIIQCTASVVAINDKIAMIVLNLINMHQSLPVSGGIIGCLSVLTATMSYIIIIITLTQRIIAWHVCDMYCVTKMHQKFKIKF